MALPKVSVVMSVHNGERYLREAVDSILSQTFRDFEFIIIDDGSTDGTASILDGYTDPRIVILHNETNIGLTRSLNRGVATARGEYIARMDADDVSLPSRFAQQVEALDKNQRLGLVGSFVYLVLDIPGRRGLLKRPQTDLEIKWHLLFDNGITHSSVMFRRDLVDKVGLYDETLKFTQDYELCSRISEQAEVSNLPRPLVIWRFSQEQISATHEEEQIRIAAMVSYANMRRLLDKAGESYEETTLVNLRALWLGRYPPLVGQTPEQVIDYSQRLFSIFARQYRPAEGGEADFRHKLRKVRRTMLARLYFHAALRHYHQEEVAGAWGCFLRGALLQPTAVKPQVLGRLALRTLAGRRLFRALKQRRSASSMDVEG